MAFNSLLNNAIPKRPKHARNVIPALVGVQPWNHNGVTGTPATKYVGILSFVIGL